MSVCTDSRYKHMGAVVGGGLRFARFRRFSPVLTYEAFRLLAYELLTYEAFRRRAMRNATSPTTSNTMTTPPMTAGVLLLAGLVSGGAAAAVVVVGGGWLGGVVGAVELSRGGTSAVSALTILRTP